MIFIILCFTTHSLDVISNNQHRNITFPFLFVCFFFQKANQKKNLKAAVLVSMDTFFETLKKLLMTAAFKFSFQKLQIKKKKSFFVVFLGQNLIKLKKLLHKLIICCDQKLKFLSFFIKMKGNKMMRESFRIVMLFQKFFFISRFFFFLLGSLSVFFNQNSFLF